MARTTPADAVFEFRFQADTGVTSPEAPKDLAHRLEAALKTADLQHLRSELVKETGFEGRPKLVSTSSTPLTARFDVEFDAHSLNDYSLADAQSKLNDVQLIIGEYLTYLLRLELDRMGFEKSARITFDHGFVHSYGLRWKEPDLRSMLTPLAHCLCGWRWSVVLGCCSFSCLSANEVERIAA